MQARQFLGGLASWWFQVNDRRDSVFCDFLPSQIAPSAVISRDPNDRQRGQRGQR
jgi:hypothetical protein